MVDDRLEVTRRAPKIEVGRIKRDRSEADNIRRSEIRNHTTSFERPCDPRSRVMLDGDMAAAPFRRPGCADSISVRFCSQLH